MIKQRICKNCHYLHMKRRNKAGESLCMVHHEYVNEADLCPDHQFHFKYLGNVNPIHIIRSDNFGKVVDPRGN